MKMTRLNPAKLYVELLDEITPAELIIPRCYTLTHSDSTGDLFLTIGKTFNTAQISGWYTRFMRDEVLAEWQITDSEIILLVHCHLSGGFVLGSASWRYQIFQRELSLVFEAFRYGDRHLFIAHPELDQALIKVKFNTINPGDQRIEDWGYMKNYSVL